MKGTENSWHKVANNIEEINFAANGIASIEVNGKIVCIARYKDTVSACSQKCPHAGGLMADGFIDALGNIVCPLHGYKFSLSNGRNVSGEGYFIKTFPVQILEKGVFIGV